MKLKNKKLNIALIIFAINLGFSNLIRSRMHKLYDLSDYEDAFMDINNTITNEINRINQSLSSLFTNAKNKLIEEESPEIQEHTLKARQKLEKINAEISEDKNNVIIRFSNLAEANIDKINIEIEKVKTIYNNNKKILHGIIPFEESSIEFVIDEETLKINKKIKVKVEKQEKTNNKNKEDINEKRIEFKFFESSISNIQQLPRKVIIGDYIKPVIKNNELTITLKKNESLNSNKNSSKLEIIKE